MSAVRDGLFRSAGGVLAATRVLESLGVLAVVGEVQRLNLLDCRLIERESA
ncbi:Transcriptional regulator, LacI family [Pseudomonas orientalis]|nr:Transcriptional regulator, LacI family [Pseudomonas orientalis]